MEIRELTACYRRGSVVRVFLLVPALVLVVGCGDSMATPESGLDPVSVVSVLAERDVRSASMAVAPNGDVWASISDSTDFKSERWAGWLLQVDGAGHVATHGPLPIFSDEANALVIDTDGGIWMANSGRFEGVWFFDGTDTVKYPEAQTDFGGARTVAIGPDGSVWAATIGGSLLRYRNGVWEEFPSPTSYGCSAESKDSTDVWGCVSSMAVDAEGVGWLGMNDYERPPVSSVDGARSRPWLIQFNGSWSIMDRSMSPLTGTVVDLEATADGAVFAMFDSESVPLGIEPGEWCRSQIHTFESSNQVVTWCSGGISRWTSGGWETVDDHIVLPESLRVSGSGPVYALLGIEPRGTAIRTYSLGQVTEQLLEVQNLAVADEFAVQAQSVWLIDQEGGPLATGILVKEYELHSGE